MTFLTQHLSQIWTNPNVGLKMSCKMLTFHFQQHLSWVMILNDIFSPTFGSNMDKPKCWVKMSLKMLTFHFQLH